jgi:hypothetical protein
LFKIIRAAELLETDRRFPMGAKRFSWTRHNKNLRIMMDPKSEDAKTVPEMKAWLEGVVRKAGREGGWRQSEIVCAIVSRHEEIDEVARRMAAAGSPPPGYAPEPASSRR